MKSCFDICHQSSGLLTSQVHLHADVVTWPGEVVQHVGSRVRHPVPIDVYLANLPEAESQESADQDEAEDKVVRMLETDGVVHHSSDALKLVGSLRAWLDIAFVRGKGIVGRRHRSPSDSQRVIV